MKFLEPILDMELEFTLVERSRLIPSTYQRDISTGLVSKLVESVRHGFFIPLLVVEKDGMYEVIDGQHRLGAADKKTSNPAYKVPVIIGPPKLKNFVLIYNTEKGDNIRDMATKTWYVYTDWAEKHPDDYEKELMQFVKFHPHLFTMAFAYRESEVESPSLVEPPVKKLDRAYLNEAPLHAAIEIRRQRGSLTRLLETTVQTVCDEYNIYDFNLKRAVVSQASQAIWGKKRNIEETFNEGMQKLMTTITSTNWSRLGG